MNALRTETLEPALHVREPACWLQTRRRPHGTQPHWHLQLGLPSLQNGEPQIPNVGCSQATQSVSFHEAARMDAVRWAEKIQPLQWHTDSSHS